MRNIFLASLVFGIFGCAEPLDEVQEIIKQNPNLIDQRTLLVCDQTTEKTHPGMQTRQRILVLESSISSRMTENEFVQARGRFHPLDVPQKLVHIFEKPYIHWGDPMVVKKGSSKIRIYAQSEKDLMESNGSNLIDRSWSIDRKTLEATWFIKGGGPKEYGVEFTKYECWIGGQDQLQEIDDEIVEAKKQHDSELVL